LVVNAGEPFSSALPKSPDMPSEKAKENKTLVAQCTACGSTVSTELIHGVRVQRGHRAMTVAVCDACRQKGWQPPPEEPQAGLS